jgi:SprT protein
MSSLNQRAKHMSYVLTRKAEVAVEDRLDQLMDQADALGLTVPRPTLNYDLRGQVAGKMGYDGTLYVNVCLLNENWDHYLEQTVGHEFAHHIVMNHYRGSSAHGSEWKRVMVRLGLPPNRTHRYDVSNSTVRRKSQYAYVCDGCGTELKMGPVRHKKQQSGKASYRHSGCGRRGTLTLKSRVKTTPVKVAASAPATPRKPQQQSWKDVAVRVFQTYPHRADFISTMVDLGAKKVTASTYHHNVKSGKWC